MSCMLKFTTDFVEIINAKSSLIVPSLKFSASFFALTFTTFFSRKPKMDDNLFNYVYL